MHARAHISGTRETLPMADVILTSSKTKNFGDEDIKKTVSRALDFLNYDFDNEIEHIVIKPNLCYYWDYSTGETTDPRVISAVIDYIRQKVNDNAHIIIAEADASAMRTKYAFKMLGYEKLGQIKSVMLTNLSEGNIANKEVVVRNKKFTLAVNRVLLDSDLIINVPKLKHHRVTGITCALKNMFGAIATPRKYVYHDELSDVIVGINKLVKSNIVIVDGIIALGRYPQKMGVLMGSNNALAADFVAAKILGYNPKRITYLSLAEKEGIGDFNNINLIEDNVRLKEIKNSFPKQNYMLQNISWKLQLKMLKFYARITEDTIPPILEE